MALLKRVREILPLVIDDRVFGRAQFALFFFFALFFLTLLISLNQADNMLARVEGCSFTTG